MLHELNEKNFDENIANGFKLVEFFANWCNFCLQQKNVLEELSRDNVWIGTVDIDKNPNLAKFYRINVFPSFILFKDCEIIYRFQGLHSKYNIMNILKDYI